MENRGGKRVGAGRPKGSTKKGTKLDEFNLLLRSQEYSEEMLGVLVDLARNSTSESIKLSAATQVLDRAHGKPGQAKMSEHMTEAEEYFLAVKEQFANVKSYGAPFCGTPLPNGDNDDSQGPWF